MIVYAEKLHTTDTTTPAAKLAHQAVRLWNMLRLNKQLARERKHLARLPDYLLADIGVAAEDAQLEANKHSLPAARLQHLGH